MPMIRLLRRCHVPALLLLSAAQVLSLTLCRAVPEAAVSLALFPLLLGPLLMLCAAAAGRVRPFVLAGCVLALFGAGYALIPHRAVSAVMPALCAALLLLALLHADKTPADASPLFYFGCVMLQALALFLLRHADAAVRNMPVLEDAFYLWLLLFLLAFNRISLNNATLARYRLSAGMARTGALLTVCVFLLSLLLCSMPAVVSAIVCFFVTLRDASLYALLWLANLFPSETAGSAITVPALMLPMGDALPAAEPPFFAVVLEKIASALSMIALIMGSAVLLRLLARLFMRLARHLLARLQRCAAAVTEDYEDEITDTRSEEADRTFRRTPRKIRQKQTYPDTPAGRIRRRYAQLLARHSTWPSSSTARENLPAETAAIYERARYSDHAPSHEDAQRFEQETR